MIPAETVDKHRPPGGRGASPSFTAMRRTSVEGDVEGPQDQGVGHRGSRTGRVGKDGSDSCRKPPGDVCLLLVGCDKETWITNLRRGRSASARGLWVQSVTEGRRGGRTVRQLISLQSGSREVNAGAQQALSLFSSWGSR